MDAVNPNHPAGSRNGWPPANLVEVLNRHLSEPIASAILDRLSKRFQKKGYDWAVPPARKQIINEISKSACLFLGSSKSEACRSELQHLAFLSQAEPLREKQTFRIKTNSDIVKSRRETMYFARLNGGSRLLCVHCGTIVSELARNILLYAGEGQIRLDLTDRKLRISASDNGPGISNLKDIMEGNFRSTTGLGLGLRGIKRIASYMDVRTKLGKGTTVVAEVELG